MNICVWLLILHILSMKLFVKNYTLQFMLFLKKITFDQLAKAKTSERIIVKIRNKSSVGFY